MWKRLVVLLAIVMTANAAILLTARRNAEGAPDATIVLSDRELQPSVQADDNTGLTLRLRLAHAREFDPARLNTEYGWLDRAKLSSLGFDCSVDPRAANADRFYRMVLPRTVWVVLAIRDAGPAEQLPENGDPGPRIRSEVGLLPSRLHVVDAANDPDTLRRRFPDRTRFAVTRAVIQVRFVEEAAHGPIILGRVSELMPPEIYVPHEWQGQIPQVRTARFTATISFGSGYLPTVTRVAPRAEAGEGGQ